MTIYQKLAAIQQDIKCPKNQYNSFGKYNYRNAEGILEAFKPYEQQFNVMLLLTDSMELLGNRYYLKAEATLIDLESEARISITAYAREADSQKGMDAAQITGCASSYARKYALNGLFLIDDAKDADTDEYRYETQAQYQNRQNVQPCRQISPQEAENLWNQLNLAGINIQALLQMYKVTRLEDMNTDMLKDIMRKINENNRNNQSNNDRTYPVGT